MSSGVADAATAVKPETGALVFSRTFPAITRHRLAMFCGASGDPNPIHVDIDFAKASGFDDVFAHGMLGMAYLGRALEKAGPPEGLREFSSRFAAITQLGAELTCEGRIASAEGDCVRLDLSVFDQNGDVKLQGYAIVDAQSWQAPIAEAQ